ncbi:MAG TPA: DNA topology modulation protein [Kofleriaceae bacterium]|jgi:adenylate kinase family enzyme
MRRVLVIGSGGAGKSTLSRRLGERTGLPVLHLDALHWRAGWVASPKDEWARTIDELTARDAWIMDGNYGGTLDRRLAVCDTVIFIDLPRTLCLRRVLWRALRYRGRTRPDMADDCPEHITLEFVQWIWRFPHVQRPKILRQLKELPAEKRVVILRSTRAVDQFLRES